MDQTNILAVSVTPLNIPELIVETNEGKKYWINLSFFKAVECFPKSNEEWKNMFLTEGGYNITWGSRFEIQILQAVDAATKSEHVKLRA